MAESGQLCYATTSALEMPSRPGDGQGREQRQADVPLAAPAVGVLGLQRAHVLDLDPPFVRPARRPSPALTARMLVEAPPVFSEKAPDAIDSVSTRKSLSKTGMPS
jgi:hypothetical protein